VVIAKLVKTTTARPHVVSDQGVPYGRQLYGLGQTFHRQPVGTIIVHLHCQRPLRSGSEVHAHQVQPSH
jgi:hypothetical protein